jgi:hypothetical protein
MHLQYTPVFAIFLLVACAKDALDDPAGCTATARERWELVGEDDAGPCSFRITLIEHEGVRYLKHGSPWCEVTDAYYGCDGEPVCRNPRDNPECGERIATIRTHHREVRVIGYFP